MLRLPTNHKLVVVMVGLPARGKTFIARKLARYLAWLGYPTRLFNVGAYRRERLGSAQPHDFFDSANPAGEIARLEVASEAMEDLLGWLREGGAVGIYDATNTTRERRAMLRNRFTREGVRVLFVESVCDDPEIIEATIRETKLKSPDYAGMDPEAAVQDFRARIAHYEAVYEPVDASDGSFIRLVDVGREVLVHDIHGFLPGRLVFFLMNLHIVPRPVWLTRHGESVFNGENRIGGDAELSPRGMAYATRLARFFTERTEPGDEAQAWTSTLRRAVQTGQSLGVTPLAWRALDEIDAGLFDGMTYEQIRAEQPDEYARRQTDKLRYRYPRGESYEDVIVRLEPVIIELERLRAPVMVVAHRAVLRALYAYFMDMEPEACTRLDIPLHTVIELIPNAYGCDERRFALGD